MINLNNLNNEILETTSKEIYHLHNTIFCLPTTKVTIQTQIHSGKQLFLKHTFLQNNDVPFNSFHPPEASAVLETSSSRL